MYMRIALAALGFVNKDINHNKMVMIDTLNNLKNKVDIVLFGEAFLQGFDSLSFEYEKDKYIPLSIYSDVIREIIETAKNNQIAVSFGFIEKEDNKVYSSQLTIDSEGNIVNLYRRVSKGWKETYATEEYCEGSSFSSFSYMDKRIAVGLCGDLWYDENIDMIKKINADIIFWPVYTDFNYEKWNKEIKYEYLEQASKINSDVLYVNSYCIDKDEKEIAKGGAILFSKGKIISEIPAGKEDILIVKID